ncbi:MAG: glycoside hydrolase family 38 C-terminal domain-containing protein [Nitrososphaeraceae archaeon]
MTTPKIHIIPHTHYDAVWILNKQDYYYINIEIILKQAINLVKNTEYKFVIEQTFLLEKIENDYPHLFEDIKNLVKKNKIEIAGGQYLLADNMIPHGEILIREIVDGKKYVKEKLGKDVKVSWGADEFGFNIQWPQILRGCGYDYFAFRRGLEFANPSEFMWQGLDGTRILTHWMPLGYRAGLFLDELDKSYKKLGKHVDTNQILMPSGSGSTPPQKELLQVIQDWNNNKYKNLKNQKHQMVISTPLKFFKDLEKENINFKIRKGEMYSGKNSSVYPNSTSSRMWLKQGTKEFENKLLLLERLDALAYVLKVHDNNISDILSKFWKKMLFVAMHDVLPGTGMDEIYKEVQDIFDNARKSLSTGIHEYLRKLSSKTNHNHDVFVFNPLSHEVLNWTEVLLNFERGEMKGISHLETEGNKIEPEVLDYSLYDDDTIKTLKIGFIICVPAIGYKTLKIIKSDKLDIEQKITHETSFQNRDFIITINPENCTLTVTNKSEYKPQLLFSGNEICLDEELGDLYYHRENLGLLKSERGDGVKYGLFKPETYEVIQGNLKSHIKFKSKYYALRWPYRFTDKLKPVLFRHAFIDIEKEVIIYKDLNRIDFITHIYDRHPHSRIRVKFDTPITSKKYWAGTQFGAIERKTDLYYDKDKKHWFEKPSGVFPSFEWIDYSSYNRNSKKRYGISLLHNGLPSHEIRNGSIYLTLLRSIVLLSSDGIMGPCIPTPDAAETKQYLFRYSILPHKGDWRSATTFKHATEINLSLITIQIKRNNNSLIEGNNNNQRDDKFLPSSYSFLKINKKNIILSTMKIEDKKYVIVRIYETEGIRTSAELTFAIKIKSVAITNLINETIQNLEMKNNNKILLDIDPFKIITLKIEF